MSYNGWKSYATWNINLWAMKDERRYRTWQRAKEAQGTFVPSSAFAAARDIFPSCKTPDGVSINDLEIDWQEIADAWNED
jgi:hypothetical protein